MTEARRTATSVTSALVAAASAVAGISGRPDEAVAVATLSAALQPILEIQVSWVLDVIAQFVHLRPFSERVLEEELIASPVKQELLIRAIDISRTAAMEEKRRAIAASINVGFESDLAASRENDVLRVIADLDLAHVLALNAMSHPRDLPDKAAFLSSMNFEAHDLGIIDVRLAGLEDRLVAVLISHGLVANETIPLYNGTLSTIRISEFGLTVLQRFS